MIDKKQIELIDKISSIIKELRRINTSIERLDDARIYNNAVTNLNDYLEHLLLVNDYYVDDGRGEEALVDIKDIINTKRSILKAKLEDDFRNKFVELIETIKHQ